MTLAGLVLYGFLRLSASLFYGRLGVSREEVGLDHAQTLAQSLFGLIFLAAYFAVAQYVIPLLLVPLSRWEGLWGAASGRGRSNARH